MSDFLIVFMHLIKTGGTTIINHMITNLPKETTDQDAGHYCQVGDCSFFSGHGANYGLKVNGKEHRYMTIIRDPADWYVSVYHHQIARDRVKNPPTFEEWYENKGTNSVNTISSGNNRMVGWFARSFAQDISDAFDVLDKCWFVGTTESLDSDLPYLFATVGVPLAYENRRVAGMFDVVDGVEIKKLYTITDEMRQQIYKDNPIDVAFYEKAKDRRDETRGNLWQ